MTITYTTKPGEYAQDYIATVGQHRIVIDREKGDYLPWCAFVVRFDGPEYVGSKTVETVLHTYAQTLAEAKQEVEKFLAAVIDPRPSYQAALMSMPAAQLIAELESCVRQNTYGSHAEQMEMVRKEIIARMSN